MVFFSNAKKNQKKTKGLEFLDIFIMNNFFKQDIKTISLSFSKQQNKYSLFQMNMKVISVNLVNPLKQVIIFKSFLNLILSRILSLKALQQKTC